MPPPKPPGGAGCRPDDPAADPFDKDGWPEVDDRLLDGACRRANARAPSAVARRPPPRARGGQTDPRARAAADAAAAATSAASAAATDAAADAARARGFRPTCACSSRARGQPRRARRRRRRSARSASASCSR